MMRTQLKVVLVFILGLLTVVAAFWIHPPARPVPRVVFITIDTTRSDHLGAYGYPRRTTPFLDSLAQKGVLYERAIASATTTAPSHAALFTGLYPSQNGVRTNEATLGEGPLTLAEAFSAAGFLTAAIPSVRFLGNVSDGFEYRDIPDPKNGQHRQAEATVDAVLRWLKQVPPDKPFFLWVHFFDVHTPAFARKQELEAFRAGSRNDAHKLNRQFKQLFKIDDDFLPASDALTTKVNRGRTILEMINRYDAQLRRVDKSIRNLYDAFETQKLNEETLWIITADHGEGLGNHNFYGHGKYLYNEHLHIPLIAYRTDNYFKPARVPDVVRHIDLFPTLAGLYNLDVHDQADKRQGQNLPGLRMDAAHEGENLAFSERRAFDKTRNYENDAREITEFGEISSLQSIEWKYIDHEDGEDELFNLKDDPRELRNLMGGQLPQQSGYKETLKTFREKIGAKSWPESEAAPNPELIQELKALGYIGQ
jgi:arylsulfatase A-like enzyme